MSRQEEKIITEYQTILAAWTTIKKHQTISAEASEADIENAVADAMEIMSMGNTSEQKCLARNIALALVSYFSEKARIPDTPVING